MDDFPRIGSQFGNVTTIELGWLYPAIREDGKPWKPIGVVAVEVHTAYAETELARIRESVEQVDRKSSKLEPRSRPS
jgi:hypothetical protein